MAITHLPLVNQKLVNAGALLSLAKNLETPGVTGSVQRRALLDSVLLQMQIAYRFYLRELGEVYGLKGLNGIAEVDELVNRLAQANKAPAEAQELYELSSDTEAWLYQLLLSSKLLSQSPPPVAEKKAFGSENLIQAIDLTETPSPAPSLDATLLETWLGLFRAMVLRHRETSAEY